MLVRVVSSVIGFPILAFLIVVGGLPLRFTILLLSIIGMLEFYNASNKKNINVLHLLSLISASIYILFLNTDIQIRFNVILSVLFLALLSLMVFLHEKYSYIDAAKAVFGFIYVCFFLSFIFLVRTHGYGKFFVWLIFISAWGCDTGAILVGKAIGKHKLVPKLSPNKTIEGSVGGILMALLLSFIYGFIVSKLYVINDINIIMLSCFCGVFGGIISQFGDLAASSIKRSTGIKDYGKIIPGHGGVLDRFDSVLFTAPIIYFIMEITISL